MFAPVRTVAPADTPVSLGEAKAHLRVEYNDEDPIITALIEAATAHLDGWTGIMGRCLVTQTWRADYAGFDDLRLPLWPVASVTSLTYRDATDTVATINAANYQVATDHQGAFIVAAPGFSWPVLSERLAPVSITAVYGDDVANVPGAIRAALLMMIGDLYVNREGAVSDRLRPNPVVDKLLAPFRRVTL